MISRLTYRSRQFWNALISPNKRVRNEVLMDTLSPAQLMLFRRMQPSEQIHAYNVFKRLAAEGHTDPDLLRAGLLHDVGKILYPLSIFERVMIVIGKRFFRKAAKEWAEGPLSGLRRAFVVAERHPDWGADLAKQAGAPDPTVELIRRHQETPIDHPMPGIESQLADLQAADNAS
jgi:hypothetical protein